MNPLGTMTPQGFLPAEPSVADLMKRAGILREGWGGFSPASPDPVDEKEPKAHTLLRSYVRLFSGHGSPPDAQAVLEDLADMSLRRGTMVRNADGTAPSIEQVALYAAQRAGQNEMVAAIFSNIEKGRALPAPGAAKQGKGKRRES